MPELDGDGRPIEFFGSHVHKNCPNRGGGHKAKVLGEAGCLAGLGCNGQLRPIEQALIGTPVANLNQPIEVLRVVHSFDPCLACSVHMLRPGKDKPVAIVQTRPSI